MDPRFIFEVFMALVGGASSIISLSIALNVANLRTEIEKSRSRDNEELRKWINGSFMRSAVVGVKLEEIDRRIQELEDYSQ